ncbi:hypothetical protein SD72_02815 [Leucobacter komagatae]|uniref:Uncharacterized protein n=1 Tax=Leucobacter komagatae TaxID=55969 RepID=A0A0D0I1I3_9MICO|nr:hypothetical protein SD72_02815 [Leucobacter komagatae]
MEIALPERSSSLNETPNITPSFPLADSSCWGTWRPVFAAWNSPRRFIQESIRPGRFTECSSKHRYGCLWRHLFQ